MLPEVQLRASLQELAMLVVVSLPEATPLPDSSMFRSLQLSGYTYPDNCDHPPKPRTQGESLHCARTACYL